MPAEIRQVEAERQASLEQVLPWLHFVWFIIDVDRYHSTISFATKTRGHKVDFNMLFLVTWLPGALVAKLFLLIFILIS
jgi:hypothetical protein